MFFWSKKISTCALGTGYFIAIFRIFFCLLVFLSFRATFLSVLMMPPSESVPGCSVPSRFHAGEYMLLPQGKEVRFTLSYTGFISYTGFTTELVLKGQAYTQEGEQTAWIGKEKPTADFVMGKTVTLFIDKGGSCSNLMWVHNVSIYPMSHAKKCEIIIECDGKILATWRALIHLKDYISYPKGSGPWSSTNEYENLLGLVVVGDIVFPLAYPAPRNLGDIPRIGQKCAELRTQDTDTFLEGFMINVYVQNRVLASLFIYLFVDNLSIEFESKKISFGLRADFYSATGAIPCLFASG